MRWTQALMDELAREERSEIGLGPHDPLDPYQLCEHHGIRVYALTELTADLTLQTLAHFSTQGTSAWSAALIPVGTARIIIENDTHAPQRRKTNIAHELGHHLLEHEFTDVILGDNHQRQFNPAQEKQATYLGRELLITTQAAYTMARQDWSNEQVAQHHGVSTQFAQHRMYAQRIRAQRTAAKYKNNSRPR